MIRYGRLLPLFKAVFTVKQFCQAAQVAVTERFHPGMTYLSRLDHCICVPLLRPKCPLVLQPEIVTCPAGTERILVLLGAAMGARWVLLGASGGRRAGRDVLPPGDEGAEGVLPQSLAVFGAEGAAQFEGGQSLADGVEFPGRLGYGAGAEPAGIAQAGDPAV